MNRKSARQLAVGLGFLAPNILGFLAFTLIPLIFSLVLAFSDWDLRRHNLFRQQPIRFVALDHFLRLLEHPDFWRFLGNTLFLMLAIPFSIAGSLILALLLGRNLHSPSRRGWLAALFTTALIGAAGLLALIGMGATGMTVLMVSFAGGILLLGMAGGSTLYRTFLYLPSFTAGVAVFILWKKLYSPTNGPINQALEPLLRTVEGLVNLAPAALWPIAVWACLILAVIAAAWGLRRLLRDWRDGETGTLAVLLSAAALLCPIVLAWRLHWLPPATGGIFALGGLLAALQLARLFIPRPFRCASGEALGGALMSASALATLQFVFIGLALVLAGLPARAAAGLAAPNWLADYYWAKPALMIMGFWAAVGSNNMLLYLAGISGIPPELYEAADLDGVTPFQKFWHVTWPRLAPTTFFIVVMSVIGGLQGGFDMARTMTQGGPAGSTTTLAYFIYAEGFETGRLGFASAAAWTLFLMVLVVTLINWRFGSRYVND